MENTSNRPRKYNFEVGEKYPTSYWGDVEILDNTNSNKIRIRFVNTGNTQTCRSADLAIGKVRDNKQYKKNGAENKYPSPKKEAATIPTGTIFKTNFYGDVVVEEYISCKKVIVKFVNTGNTQAVQKDALLKGLLHDVKEKKRISAEKEKQKKIEKTKQKIEKERLSKKRKEAAALVKKQEAQLKKQEKKVQKEKEILSVVGERFTDKLGMKFSIISRDLESLLCMVQYEETGNTYEYTYQNITGGQYDVYDRKSPEFDNKYKQYAKNRSIQYYEENREELLKKALQYQKENPEKANHYNRIRRGKREKAEGSHTQEEVLQLLVDQDNKCACCDTSFLLVKKHLDHKHPIALGGSNYIENLQWLCAFCNLVKNDSHPDVWEEYSQSEEFKQRRSRRLLTV